MKRLLHAAKFNFIDACCTNVSKPDGTLKNVIVGKVHGLPILNSLPPLSEWASLCIWILKSIRPIYQYDSVWIDMNGVSNM